MIRLVTRGPSEKTTSEFTAHVAEQLTAALKADALEARVLGPAPAPFAKLRGRYRFQLQVQGPGGARLRQEVARVTGDLQPPEEVQWIVDVDPLDML